mmetsp:Transcript_5034/g.9656  ORF Transcript_5034/g.9656 Transcript_5034/m.9656 type:complete len:531 (-) Transcript_5034:1679-3271(-)
MTSDTTNITTATTTTNDAKPMLEDKLDGDGNYDSSAANGKFEAIAAATTNSNDKDSNDTAMDDVSDEKETVTEGGEHSSLAARPIVCILEEPMRPAASISLSASSSSSSSAATKKRQRCRMFRVIRSKGKALASGGFGVTVVTDLSGNEQEQDDDDHDEDEEEVENSSVQKDSTTTTAVAITKEENNKNDNDDDATKETKSVAPTVTTSTTRSAEYLFIEEVLFLHEKGLLRALMPSSSSSSSSTSTSTSAAIVKEEEADDGDDRVVGTTTTHTCTHSANDNDSIKLYADDATAATKPLDTSQLYQLLPLMGISLAVYRVYSHLRSQDFRVLRHDPDRYDILCKQQKDQEERKQRLLERQQLERQQMQQKQQKEGEHGNNGEDEDDPPLPRKIPRKQSLRLRRKIRESIQKAPPPTIPFPGAIDNNNDNDNDDGDTSDKKKTLGICWDAYNPNSHFGKTHPGLPDFYVTATYYNVPTVRFSDLKDLLRDDKCQGIPLKVATVSDSGTVVMFGVTDYGIPPLDKKKRAGTK